MQYESPKTNNNNQIYKEQEYEDKEDLSNISFNLFMGLNNNQDFADIVK